jgi:hypothetical protein
LAVTGPQSAHVGDGDDRHRDDEENADDDFGHGKFRFAPAAIQS